MPTTTGNDVRTKPKSVFRPDIQGLRTIAVVAVIVDHLFHWPGGGFVGVDIFFVISGYLITGLLLREHAKTGHISFTKFYARRIKRILPAALLVLIATVVAAYFLTPGIRFARTLNDSLWAAVFAGNWNLGLQGTDYFQTAQIPSPVQHFWSLAEEEQFYFVWPWLMLAVLAIGFGIFKWTHGQSRLALGLTIGSITVASFAYSLFLSSTDPNWAYFNAFSRAWELGVGALLAIFAYKFTTQNIALRTAMGWVGLIGILTSLFVVTSAGFPAPGAILPVLSTGLVLLAGENASQPYLWPLTNRGAQHVGNLSYSLYLWHFPVIILLLAVLPETSPTYFVAALLATAALSMAGYFLVENPIRKSGWLTATPEEKRTAARRRRRARRRRSARYSRFGGTQSVLKYGALAVAAAAAVVVVVIAFQPPAVSAIAGSAPNPSTSASPQDTLFAQQKAAAAAKAEAARCVGAPVRDSTSGCSLTSLDGVLRPAAGDAEGDNQSSCWIDAGQPIDVCHFGAGPLRVAVVGDSHGQDLLTALAPSANAQGWKMDAYIGNQCLLSTEAFPKCAAHQPILDALVAMPAYDVVITTAARVQQASVQGFTEEYQAIVATGAKLIVVADVPAITDDALLCVQRVGFDPANNDCGSAPSSQPDNQIEAAKAVPGVQVVDMTSFYWVASP
ncbi:acyltransferase family protein [Subtercola endophyticus]|uniref:acyltransferase family protein n=1 Tax=Subtercola endophyticus TaxID=2895559 RepID=UPI001E3ACE5B|nr:acyltransferase family protein [Subtercola endophyticus]UFS57851.1 acyltransferase [Subtercola endophyticus]